MRLLRAATSSSFGAAASPGMIVVQSISKWPKDDVAIAQANTRRAAVANDESTLCQIVLRGPYMYVRAEFLGHDPGPAARDSTSDSRMHDILNCPDQIEHKQGKKAQQEGGLQPMAYPSHSQFANIHLNVTIPFDLMN